MSFFLTDKPEGRGNHGGLPGELPSILYFLKTIFLCGFLIFVYTNFCSVLLSVEI